jgi:hypothetical protein
LSLTLRKKHRLRVFENKILRRIFESKLEEVTGGWIKFDNEEFQSCTVHKYYFHDYVMEDVMGRSDHVTHAGEMVKEYRTLVGKPEGKKPFGSTWHKWKNNIDINLKEKLCIRVWTEFICIKSGKLAASFSSSGVVFHSLRKNNLKIKLFMHEG